LQRFGGLWRHPDFLKLWLGQTVSLGGSLVSRVAVPLVAILTLDATPGEVALLRIADLVPGIVIGLFAGVWVDRMRRRPLMIWADLGRAVLLGSMPLAALGALAYFVVFSLAILAAFSYQLARPLLAALVTVMLLMTLWLLYLQAFVIRHFCQYCLLSAAVTTVVTAIVWGSRIRQRRS